jgi:hypothetical protein
MKGAVTLIAVQAFDRIVQAAFGVQAAFRRQRIVQMSRPTFFFKRRQDQLLILGRNTEALDDPVVDPEDAMRGIPPRRREAY